MNEQYKIPELPKEDPDYVKRVNDRALSPRAAAIMAGAGIAAAGFLASAGEEAPKTPDQPPTVATSTPTTERNAPVGYIDVNDPNALAIRIANGSANSHEPGIFSGEGSGAAEADSIPDSVVNPDSTQLETIQVVPDTKPQN
jgi:hypothetical protein